MHKFIFISPIIIILASCFPSTLLPSSTVPTNDISSYTPTQTSQVAATLQTSSAPIATLESADQIFYSSDKNFVAKRYSLYSRPSLDGPVIEIYNSQNELLWQIPYQGEISTGDPSSSLSIYRWSKDNKYLYFYYVFYPDGGDYAFWWDGFNLQRIDVQTGKTEQVIPSDPKSFEAFSFSPDETQIAYTRQQDNPYIFYIRDLLTGVERTSYILFPSKNYSRVGNIHWSPSGEKLVFQTETKDFMVQTILTNPFTLKQKVIQEYSLFSWIFLDGWISNENIQFSQLPSSYNEPITAFQIDVESLEKLEIGTATPSP